jgi:glycosyltransferase 2 family protein
VDKDKVKNYLKLLLRLLVSAAALYYVFSKINFIEVISTYRSANILFLVSSVLLFILSKIISAYRLNLFFKAINLELCSRFNLKLYLLGMFYNLFLPGGVGGDGYKIFFLDKRFDIGKRKVFWSVFFDRISGVIALFILAVIFSYFIKVNISFPYKYYVWILIPVVLFIFYQVLKVYFSHFIGVFWNTLMYSMLVQIAQVFCALLILFSIGTPDMVMNYLFVFLISSIVAMLPISIGGVGLRELTFLYGAGILNLNTEISVALSLMFYLISLLVSLFGIYFSLNPAKIK